MELTKEYLDPQLGNLATKRDLERLASKQDLAELRDDVHIMKSDVTALQDDLRSVKSDVSEIKEILMRLDERDVQDSNAFAKTLVKHDDRITAAENQIKQLKLKSV